MPPFQVDGNFTLVYGTSAAAPVVGAMLAMINDARIARDKARIGFINPVVGVFLFFSVTTLLT